MRVYLHIGTEKTGTTSIQAYCTEHARALRARGILYPAGFGRRNHRDLAIAVADNGATADLRGYARAGEAELPAFRAGVFERLEAQIRRARPAVVLLSSEHLSSRLDDAGIGRLRARLGELSDDIRVLVYLRRQDDVLLSLYSTYVKAGGVGDLAFLAGVHWFDYAQLLERWGATFGKERLVVRLYPAERGSLTDDFCAAAELPRLAEPQQERLNRTLDHHSIELLVRLNARLPAFRDGAFNPDRVGIAQFMQGRLGKTDPVMPAAERRRFLARFQPGNEAVRARYFPDRAALFDDVPADDADPPPEVTIDDALDLAAEFWADRARLAARVEALERQRLAARLNRALRPVRGILRRR
jgi:hypothetical protein